MRKTILKRKRKQRNKHIRQGIRLIATLFILFFIFFEEIVLKPLRKIKIVVLEKTIKRLNGYWTIGILVTLKTIEGLMKIAIIIFPEPIFVTVVLFFDALFGFISMNIIIHGRENLQEFAWYMRFANWVDGLKEEVKQLPAYKKAHTRVLEIKGWVKDWWTIARVKIFGKRNPRSIFRYVRTVVYLKMKRSKKRKERLEREELERIKKDTIDTREIVEHQYKIMGK